MIIPPDHLPRTKSGVETFDQLPDVALVRLPVVRALFGISSATVWRWAKDGRLPPPVRTGRVTAWPVGALRATLPKPLAAEPKAGSSC